MIKTYILILISVQICCHCEYKQIHSLSILRLELGIKEFTKAFKFLDKIV